MKDSNVGWIGKIPDDWNIARLKYYLSLNGRIGWQGLTANEYQDEGPYLITGVDFIDGVVDWDGCVHVPIDRYEQAPDIMIRNGDLLITKDGTVGKLAMVENMPDKTTLNSGVMVIRNRNTEIDIRFLFYVLMSEEFWRWFGDVNAGATTITHLYQHDFDNFKFAFPKISEQKLIAALLDEKVGKLKKLKNSMRKQIEILEQSKKAIISEAVTGRMGNYKLKKCEDKFCGNIAEHFACRRMRFLIKDKLKYGANETGDNELQDCPRYIRITDITADNKLKEEGKQYLPKDVAKPFMLKNGDILFARSGATVGKTFFYEDKYGDAAFAGYLIKAVADEDIILSKYLWYYTLSNNYELWKDNVFTQTTIQNIGADKYALLPITFPMDLNEQQQIIDYLDRKCGAIDRVLAVKKQQLEKLEIHERSMIYDYVTGVKRVKGAI